MSNADPEWMRSVQQQYHLDGTLDTDSDYAGNAGKGEYYPEVKSTNSGTTDYAGYPGQPIQLLSINVYRNDGVKIRTGVVVMYRVHVDNRWLPWIFML